MKLAGGPILRMRAALLRVLQTRLSSENTRLFRRRPASVSKLTACIMEPRLSIELIQERARRYHASIYCVNDFLSDLGHGPRSKDGLALPRRGSRRSSFLSSPEGALFPEGIGLQVERSTMVGVIDGYYSARDLAASELRSFTARLASSKLSRKL